VAIKRAIGVHRTSLVGFETCHVWPRTCYDERYHTAIANLLLLPRALAGLTDHNREVQAAIQFRAFSLYGWHPDNQPQPIQPLNYPAYWCPPIPFSGVVERALLRRRLSLGGIKECEERLDLDDQAVGCGRDYTRYNVHSTGKRC